MVKKAGKGKLDPRKQEDLVEPDYPQDAMPVETTAGGFFTFDVKGQQLRGTLVGTEQVKRSKPKPGESEYEERWVMLPDGSSDTVYLPNHFDLDARLKKLIADGFKLPIQNVWIQMRGTRPAPTVKSGYVVVYAVAVKRGEQVAL